MMRAVVLLVALSALACRSPTQITLDVSTDEPCTSIQSTSLVAGPLAALTDGRPATTTAPACTGSTGHIGSIVVVPSGDDGDLVAVKVVTGVSVPPDQCGPEGQGCIVAKRALRYAPHTALTVKIEMSSHCEGISCPGEETCVQGTCRSALIDDPTTCEGSGCDELQLDPADGGAPSDAGPSIDATLPNDGSIDAPSDAPSDAPTTLGEGGSLTPTSIGISENFACALLPDHTVACWGHDDVGELGDGTEADASYAPTPVRVPGLDHVTQLAVGEMHACVLLDDAGVSCWGFGEYGATGTNDGVDDLVPTHVNGIAAAGLIASGQNETCAASVDRRTIWCWGIFLAEYDGTDLPQLVPAVDAGVVELSAGRAVTCGRFDDDVVRCWGQNGYDVLGQGTTLDASASTVPLAVAGLPDPAQISVAWAQACVLDTSHVLRCWGEDDEGALGPIADAGPGTPAVVAIDPHVTKVACGEVTTCVRYDDGGVACWGYDGDGELGITNNGDEGIYTEPVTIPNLGPTTDIFAGGYGQCAILVDGGVACWGNDANLQLGAGNGLGATPLGAFPVTF